MSRPGELSRAWVDAGLRDVVQDSRTIRMEFERSADVWAPAEGRKGPIAARGGALDAAARDRLRDAVRRAFLDGEGDGPRSYAATTWVVRGTVP